MGNLKMRPLWTLAGAYLLYLAYQQARLLDGRTETRGEAVLCIVSGAVFAAVGAWVLWREWKYAHAADDSGEGSDTADNSGEIAETADDSGEIPNTADDSGDTEDGV